MKKAVTTEPRALSPLTYRVGQLFVAALIVALIMFFPSLSERLSEAGGYRAAAFYVAYAFSMGASIYLLARIPALSAAASVVKHRYVRSALLGTNLLLAAILILYAGRHWGVLALMLLYSVGIICYLLLSPPKRLAMTDEMVRCSPITFLIVYLVIAVGEVYLRFHPVDVGGGGGGNPALRQLYTGLYSYNSLGLRDVEVTRNKPENVFRILTVGDSFTFGQGVPLKDTYPKQLETLLNESSGGKHYEVINAGQPGVNTKWEHDYIAEHGLALEPTLIVVQFYRNDLRKMYDSTKSQRIVDVLEAPIRQSYALFWLRHRIKNLTTSVEASGNAPGIRKDDPGWHVCAEAIDDLGRLRRTTDIPIVMILFPHPGERPSENTLRLHKAVAERCKTANLHVIDLVGAVNSVRLADQVVSNIDHHPSSTVHHVVAQAIRDYLCQQELLSANAK